MLQKINLNEVRTKDNLSDASKAELTATALNPFHLCKFMLSDDIIDKILNKISKTYGINLNFTDVYEALISKIFSQVKNEELISRKSNYTPLLDPIYESEIKTTEEMDFDHKEAMIRAALMPVNFGRVLSEIEIIQRIRMQIAKDYNIEFTDEHISQIIYSKVIPAPLAE